MNTAATPKTIQIFLPGGDPVGIRVAEITTRIVQIIDVPRKRLPDFLKMPESAQVGVYFLVAEPEDGEPPQVYVGQSGDLRGRLRGHDANKDFWERVLVLISRTNLLTQTHALYLEWRALQCVQEAGRYVPVNGNAGSRPHTPAPMQADCEEIFETGKTLLATLGHPLFDAVAASAQDSDEAHLFHCRSSDAHGQGQYTSEGFVVLAGSLARRGHVPSVDGTGVTALRQRLQADGVLRTDGDMLLFTRDHLFRSPSMAAAVVLGRTANGWIEWRDDSGRTLDAVKRQAIDG